MNMNMNISRQLSQSNINLHNSIISNRGRRQNGISVTNTSINKI